MLSPGRASCSTSTDLTSERRLGAKGDHHPRFQEASLHTTHGHSANASPIGKGQSGLSQTHPVRTGFCTDWIPGYLNYSLGNLESWSLCTLSQLRSCGFESRFQPWHSDTPAYSSLVNSRMSSLPHTPRHSPALSYLQCCTRLSEAASGTC